jgi:protein-disulfide isomerase
MGVLLVLSLLLWRPRSNFRAAPSAVLWGLALTTSVAVGLQAAFMERDASKPPIPAERLRDISTEELVDAAKSLGPSDAPVTIIIFGDLWCPGCRSIHAPLVEYQRKHPAGVRLVYRHLPLYQISGHQFSGTAAALSEIAAEQEQFWNFVDLLYQQRGQLRAAGYLQLLNGLSINASEAAIRLKNPDEPAYARVLSDMDLARQLGIYTTPTFILLIEGQEPISANLRTLQRLLNLPVVQRLITLASQKEDPGSPPWLGE